MEGVSKPLYSALGAWLYLSNDPSNIPQTTEGQAKYWKRYYNTSEGDGEEQDFIDCANRQENADG